MSGYYAVVVRVEREEGGWRSFRHLPTFYLHEDVQGILDPDGAVKVAIAMFADVLDLAGDDSVQVFAEAVKV